MDFTFLFGHYLIMKHDLRLNVICNVTQFPPDAVPVELRGKILLLYFEVLKFVISKVLNVGSPPTVL